MVEKNFAYCRFKPDFKLSRQGIYPLTYRPFGQNAFLFHNHKDFITRMKIDFDTRGIKKIFMTNLAEHEILNSYKYKNIKKFSTFFRLR